MAELKHRGQLRDENIDLGIIGKGFVSLYHDEAILSYDVDLLRKKQYKIIEFGGSTIATREELHASLEHKLNLEYYGRNFDGFEDRLIDYKIDENGVVLVFRHLDKLDIDTISILLDIFAIKSRRKFAIGLKLLVLVQFDNPNFKMEKPIGAINFNLWNDKEWRVMPISW